jgi:hypothetical protein
MFAQASRIFWVRHWVWLTYILRLEYHVDDSHCVCDAYVKMVDPCLTPE